MGVRKVSFLNQQQMRISHINPWVSPEFLTTARVYPPEGLPPYLSPDRSLDNAGFRWMPCDLIFVDGLGDTTSHHVLEARGWSYLTGQGAFRVAQMM